MRASSARIQGDRHGVRRDAPQRGPRRRSDFAGPVQRPRVHGSAINYGSGIHTSVAAHGDMEDVGWRTFCAGVLVTAVAVLSLAGLAGVVGAGQGASAPGAQQSQSITHVPLAR
ncbi:MAG: hypothetical protein GX542_05585 [Rhodococcus sp.]|nr:hypothetical protein [Rhodococcus sp. (in: high G+C Gram-positive bacteria)]